MKRLQTGIKRTVYGFLPIFAIACGMLLGACSNDEDAIIPGEESPSLPEKEITVYVYPGIEESDGVTPRMTIVDGDELCSEFYDPSQPEVYVFHYMNTATQQSAFMTASEKGVTIMEDDPFHPSSAPNMTLVTQEEQEIVISFGTYSKSDNSFHIKSVKRIEGGETPVVAAKTRADDMDFARELVMKNIIRPLSDAIGKAHNIISDIPGFQAATHVLEAWSDWGLIVAEAQLYANDEEEFKQLLAEKMFVHYSKKIKFVGNALDRMDKANRIYGTALAAYRDARGFEEDYDDDMSEEFILTTTDSYSFTSRQAQEVVWKVYDESQAYKPTISLVSVKGQSASVRGNFSNYDGRFTVTGYYLYHDSTGDVEKVSAPLNGSVYTFTNLSKGESYTATAFATVMGVTYESLPVSFRIEGDLELSAYELAFSDVGGKTSVQVTLPSDKWKWNATSSAQWCKATPSKDNTLTVEVSSSSESREAIVTVTATSLEGATQSKTINVQQKSIGNYALFMGKCKMVTKTTYPSKPSYNFTNEINIDLHLLMMRMGGSTTISLPLVLNGISFSNWTVSNTPPPTSMLQEGYSITNFSCVSSQTRISIDGSTKGPDNETGEFTVKIDLSTLSVTILESSKDTGIGYPGMAGPTEYNSQSTLSGTLYYTEEYNN